MVDHLPRLTPYFLSHLNNYSLYLKAGSGSLESEAGYGSLFRFLLFVAVYSIPLWFRRKP